MRISNATRAVKVAAALLISHWGVSLLGAETPSVPGRGAPLSSSSRAGLTFKPGDKITVARSGSRFMFSGRTIATLEQGTEITVGSIGPNWIAGYVMLKGIRTAGYLDVDELKWAIEGPAAEPQPPAKPPISAVQPAIVHRPVVTEPLIQRTGRGTAVQQAAEHLERGLAFDRMGDRERAIAELNEAIRLDPKCARAYPHRGLAQFRKKEYDQAIADFTEALRFDPKSVITLVDRGAAYSKKGDFDRAIADCAAALQLDPKSSLAYAQRGCAYKGKGDYDHAIADCTEAIRFDPYNARAFYCRAIAWASKGERIKADADFAAASKLGYRPVKPGVE